MQPHTSALVLYAPPATSERSPPCAPRSPCLLRSQCCLTLSSDPAKSEVIASAGLLWEQVLPPKKY